MKKDSVNVNVSAIVADVDKKEKVSKVGNAQIDNAIQDEKKATKNENLNAIERIIVDALFDKREELTKKVLSLVGVTGCNDFQVRIPTHKDVNAMRVISRFILESYTAYRVEKKKATQIQAKKDESVNTIANSDRETKIIAIMQIAGVTREIAESMVK